MRAISYFILFHSPAVDNTGLAVQDGPCSGSVWAGATGRLDPSPFLSVSASSAKGVLGERKGQTDRWREDEEREGETGRRGLRGKERADVGRPSGWAHGHGGSVPAKPSWARHTRLAASLCKGHSNISLRTCIFDIKLILSSRYLKKQQVQESHCDPLLFLPRGRGKTLPGRYLPYSRRKDREAHSRPQTDPLQPQGSGRLPRPMSPT